MYIFPTLILDISVKTKMTVYFSFNYEKQGIKYLWCAVIGK